jgi:hypothetical protein
MPDLLTANYQWQLDTTLYGTGNGGVSLDGTAQGIEGLGVPDTKTQDVEYFGKDGVKPNPDYLQIRIITIPAIFKVGNGNANIAAVWSSHESLCTVWAPVTASVYLAFQLPGYGKIHFNGRPRGVKSDLSKAQFGVIRALLRFDAVDSAIHAGGVP